MFARPKSFPKNLATSNNAAVRSFEILEANFDSISRNYNYPIEISFKALFQASELQWSLVKNSMNGGLLSSQYSGALNEVLGMYNSAENLPLPILAVITDSFPHQEANIGARAKKMVRQQILPRDLGYYGWDERTSCIQLWLSRFYQVSTFDRDVKIEIDELEEQLSFYNEQIKINPEEKDIINFQKKIRSLRENIEFRRAEGRRVDYASEKEFIQNKLITFSRPLDEAYGFINNDIELYRLSVTSIKKGQNTLEFSFKDGRVINFDSLPMGYKRIFSIVLDLSYRSFILNQGLESEGIVLIDEIELHLHPTIQQDILQRLRSTFPNIQFIITTHSPLVISNFRADENNKIIRLEQEGNEYNSEALESVFGLDYSTNLSEIMGAAPRSSTIDKYINAYVFLKNRQKHMEADSMLSRLKDYVGGTIPILVREEIDKKLRK
jgi:hypothetical protein